VSEENEMLGIDELRSRGSFWPGIEIE